MYGQPCCVWAVILTRAVAPSSSILRRPTSSCTAWRVSRFGHWRRRSAPPRAGCCTTSARSQQLLAEAVASLQARYEQLSPSDAEADACVVDFARRLWRRGTAPEALSFLRLYFELYASALRAPEANRAFLDNVVGQWLTPLIPALEAGGLPPTRARDRYSAGSDEHRPGGGPARHRRPRARGRGLRGFSFATRLGA